MARKRRPFMVAGEALELSAPGLNILRGEAYWLASKDAGPVVTCRARSACIMSSPL
jgi:hypothetical protein